MPVGFHGRISKATVHVGFLRIQNVISNLVGDYSIPIHAEHPTIEKCKNNLNMIIKSTKNKMKMKLVKKINDNASSKKGRQFCEF